MVRKSTPRCKLDLASVKDHKHPFQRIWVIQVNPASASFAGYCLRDDWQASAGALATGAACDIRF